MNLGIPLRKLPDKKNIGRPYRTGLALNLSQDSKLLLNIFVNRVLHKQMQIKLTVPSPAILPLQLKKPCRLEHFGQ